VLTVESEIYICGDDSEEGDDNTDAQSYCPCRWRIVMVTYQSNSDFSIAFSFLIFVNYLRFQFVRVLRFQFVRVLDSIFSTVLHSLWLDSSVGKKL